MKKIFEFLKRISENKTYIVCRTIIKVLLYVILLSVIFMVIVQRVSNNSVAVGGIRMYIVASGSMEPLYTVGDVLIAKSTPASELQIGDTVTYLGDSGSVSGMIITHNIIDKRLKDDKYEFITQGLANEYADHPIDESQIYGKVVYKVKFLSWLSRIITNLKWYFIVCFIVGLMFSIQVVRIIIDKDDNEDDDEEDNTMELPLVKRNEDDKDNE